MQYAATFLGALSAMEEAMFNSVVFAAALDDDTLYQQLSAVKGIGEKLHNFQPFYFAAQKAHLIAPGCSLTCTKLRDRKCAL